MFYFTYFFKGEKPYKCTQCEKTFVSMGVLRQHLRTHTGVKEFKCSVCHALFTTNGSLTRHMNIHVAIKPYKCPFCLEGFRTASICKKHMKEHTGGGRCQCFIPLQFTCILYTSEDSLKAVYH
jgi:uncharacterized Zn-finger protein